MSFPRYPIYKDSGVETVTGIPQAWTPTRLRFLLRDGYNGLKIGPFGSQLTSEMLANDGNYKVYGQENVIANDFARGSRYINEDKFQELSVYEVTPGDLLITMMGTSGRCDVAPLNLAKGIMDSHLLRMRVTPSVSAEFVRLLIDEAAYVGMQIELAGKGSIMHGLNSAIVKNLLLFIPSADEQSQILTFLGRETEKIDALVAEQRRLMDLLKEKRQAVISHAVTRGLKRDAPMKPSGINWLEDVPAHWEVCSIRRIVVAIEQGWSPECFSRPAEDEEWGVLKAGCVNRGIYDQNDNKALPAELAPMPEYEVQIGDVLMSRASGSPELVGSTALVTSTRKKLMLSDKIFRLRFERQIEPKFFVAALNSRPLRSQIEQALSGGNGLANNLPQASLRGFFLAVPPKLEQQEICDYLESESSKFDTLIAEAQRAIDLLQERRTALISAAVTGQIDVREISEKEPQ